MHIFPLIQRYRQKAIIELRQCRICSLSFHKVCQIEEAYLGLNNWTVAFQELQPWVVEVLM